MKEIDLQGEQLEAFNKCVAFLLNQDTGNKFLKFGAFAGTGKTYVLRKVINFLESYQMKISVIAFTGRAAAQLSDEGVSAITCHSLLYKPNFDHNGNLTGWVEKDLSEILDICRDGIIVDEGSMIPSNIHRRLSQIGVKIIYSGDISQLEPVEMDPAYAGFNVMDNKTLKCDEITLVENRRFDINNGIGYLSLHLRENNSFPRIKKDCLTYQRKSSIYNLNFHTENKYDIVLCGMNKTRKRINQLIRTARGFESEIPEIGETIVCLRNSVLSNGQKINNGELFTVEGVIEGPEQSTYMIRGEKGLLATVKVMNETWYTEDAPMVKGETALFCFGFGYCLSVHKAQGSTFGKVLFVDEDVSFFLDQRKYRYTGCTRASEQLDVAL